MREVSLYCRPGPAQVHETASLGALFPRGGPVQDPVLTASVAASGCHARPFEPQSKVNCLKSLSTFDDNYPQNPHKWLRDRTWDNARRAFRGEVDVRLPGKENSNFHGARPVYLIIPMIKWIRTSRLSIKNSLSLVGRDLCQERVKAADLVPQVLATLLEALLCLVLLLYRGTSLTRKRPCLGPYSRPVPRSLCWY